MELCFHLFLIPQYSPGKYSILVLFGVPIPPHPEPSPQTECLLAGAGLLPLLQPRDHSPASPGNIKDAIERLSPSSTTFWGGKGLCDMAQTSVSVQKDKIHRHDLLGLHGGNPPFVREAHTAKRPVRVRCTRNKTGKEGSMRSLPCVMSKGKVRRGSLPMRVAGS